MDVGDSIASGTTTEATQDMFALGPKVYELSGLATEYDKGGVFVASQCAVSFIQSSEPVLPGNIDFRTTGIGGAP